MALEGSLKEFNLADILQLLFFQKKTGALSLHGRKDKVRLLFSEGNIVGAESKRRGTERLGNVLVKRGIITDSTLQAAIDRQKAEGGKLGAILVREGFATKKQIQDVITFQINETMVQLFSWREGKYEFIPQAIPVDKDIGVTLDTQHFLMEGLRMMDEWSVISDKVTIDTIYVKTGAEIEEMLSPEEEEIINLVDGESDVGTISEFCGKDSFAVSTTLLSLQEKGVVAKKIEEVKEEPEVPVWKEARPIPGLGAILTVLLLAAFAVSLYFSVTDTALDLKPSFASEDLDMMRYEIGAFRADRGGYPPSVEGTDPWGNPYVYRMDPETGYSLMSPGPDGRPGTADDIY